MTKTYLLTEPASEPISRADIKAHLRVTHDDEDGLIDAYAIAARVHIENQIGQKLITQTWRLVTPLPANHIIKLPLAPVERIEQVRQLDADGSTAIVAIVHYNLNRLDGPFVTFADNFVSTAAHILEIDVVCGFGQTSDAVPAPIRHAIMLLAAHWHEHRAGLWGSAETRPFPPALPDLLAPYRVIRL